MKRFFIILFSGFYLATSVGIAFNVHYCADRVASVELLSTDDKCCCDDRPGEVTCCHNKPFFYQLDDDQHINQSFRVTKQSPVNGLTAFILYDDQTLKNKGVSFKYTDLPPPQQKDIRLLNCSLTFYG